MFDAPEFIEESIQQMKATIDDVAIIACSGGVDSTVAAVIANKAVGDLLHCVYVDTGFMRKNETEEIETMLAQQGINLITVKAADRYFEALQGVTEPEQKRKVIGELFIRIFEDEQKKCGAKYLVQGTIAPDWIESGGGVRDTIKSHHNVGGLPEVNIHGKTGFLSDLGNVEEMAHFAIEILKNDDTLQQFKANAFAQAKQFDVENIIHFYEDAFTIIFKS